MHHSKLGRPTSAVGQNPKNSHRAHVGGSSPDNGHCSARLARQKSANQRSLPPFAEREVMECLNPV